MTQAEAMADVFWKAFRSMTIAQQRAFLKKLSTEERYREIFDDYRYGEMADERKKEPRRSLSDILETRRTSG